MNNQVITIQEVHSKKNIDIVVCLARKIWQEHYLPIIGQKQIDYMLDKFQSKRAILEQINNLCEYYIINYHGHSAGYMAFVPDKNENTLMLSKLYVRKSERGLGLGKMMLEFVENICMQRCFMNIWLTVNKNNIHSISWYLKMGFKKTGSIVQDIGEGFVMDDFILEKTIKHNIS